MEAGNKVDRANPLFDKIIPVKIVNGPEIDSNALVCRLLMRYRTTSGGQVNRSYRLEVRLVSLCVCVLHIYMFSYLLINYLKFL